MLAAREKFLEERDATTLRVACWPAPIPRDALRLDLRDRALRAALQDGQGVGVRASGWNDLSSSQLRITQGVPFYNSSSERFAFPG
jgi:hypothetical protein